MCIFKTPEMPEAMPSPPPITPRVEDTTLPKAQDVVDKDAPKAEVTYGSKQQDQQSGKKTGSSALRIDVNTGQTGGGSGLNV